MSQMKIAFCNREDWNNPLGGDGIQMLKTKESLERLYNLDICIITNPNKLDSTFSFIHVFNYATVSITKLFFERAEQLGLKIISSPVFWEYKYAIMPITMRFGFYPSFVSERYMNINIQINNIISKLTNIPLLISPKFKNYLEFFLKKSNLILPNSKEEGELLLEHISKEKDFTLNSYRNKIKIVYNGVGIQGLNIMDKDDFFAKYNIPKNYVLQVSRIQNLKNQLNLIAALASETDIPLVFVGKIIEPKYFNHLKKIAEQRGNVYFLPEVDHSDIYSFYFYAKTHVLLSLRESPGLVSLEALSQGCPIVVADKRFAPVNTYFDTSVEIVNPLSKDSIRDSVLRSLSKDRVKMDMSQFSWDNVARQTYEAYLSIV